LLKAAWSQLNQLFNSPRKGDCHEQRNAHSGCCRCAFRDRVGSTHPTPSLQGCVMAGRVCSARSFNRQAPDFHLAVLLAGNAAVWAAYPARYLFTPRGRAVNVNS
jgi:hypothetical protein